jgi:CheY-like chemotaxis protein
MSRPSGSPVHLNVVGDGEQAMQFLRRAGAFADAPRPGLIVLDLNLPRRTGLEVLADLKADRDLLVIPVLILTTSAAPADIQRSYLLHANAYIIKPAGFDSFTDAINQIASWFLRLIKLPRHLVTGLAIGRPLRRQHAFEREYVAWPWVGREFIFAVQATPSERTGHD